MTSSTPPTWAYVPYEGEEGLEFGDQFWTGGFKYTWTAAGVDDDDGGYWLQEDLPPFAAGEAEPQEDDLAKRLAKLEAELASLQPKTRKSPPKKAS